MKTTVNKMIMMIDGVELQKEFEQFMYKVTKDEVLNKQFRLIGDFKEYEKNSIEHKKAIDKFNEAYDSKIYNLLEHMLTKI